MKKNDNCEAVGQLRLMDSPLMPPQQDDEFAEMDGGGPLTAEQLGDILERDAASFASIADLAAIARVPEERIRKEFMGRVQRGWARARLRVLKAQLALAEAGNGPMLTSLGKEYLRQGEGKSEAAQHARRTNAYDSERPGNTGLTLEEARKLDPDELVRIYRAALGEPGED